MEGLEALALVATVIPTTVISSKSTSPGSALQTLDDKITIFKIHTATPLVKIRRFIRGTLLSINRGRKLV